MFSPSKFVASAVGALAVAGTIGLAVPANASVTPPGPVAVAPPVAPVVPKLPVPLPTVPRLPGLGQCGTCGTGLGLGIRPGLTGLGQCGACGVGVPIYRPGLPIIRPGLRGVGLCGCGTGLGIYRPGLPIYRPGLPIYRPGLRRLTLTTCGCDTSAGLIYPYAYPSTPYSVVAGIPWYRVINPWVGSGYLYVNSETGICYPSVGAELPYIP